MPSGTPDNGGRQTADFFGAQRSARLRSALLLVYFNTAVAVMVVALYFLAAFFIIPPRDVIEQVRAHGTSFANTINSWLPTGYLAISHRPWERRWWDPELFFSVAAAVALVIYGTAAWRLAVLRRLGGRGIAEALGATLLNRRSPNLADLQFWNTIEEMALAAEMPMPAAYVLERETGINAFAAGHGPKDAAIGITRGALNLLDRGEIQGMVAHEFSHVVNGDMRLNTRVVGMLHGLVLIADMGERIAEIGLGGESETAERPAGAACVVVGNAVQLLGSIGVAFAQVIKAALCRQREYLADAAALQYTRDPAAIGGALRKIAALPGGGVVRAPGRTAICHAFFCNAVGGWGRLLSTHPDIVDRILAVDPQWDGTLPNIDTNRLPPSPRFMRVGELAIDPDRGRSIEDRMGAELARVIALNATSAHPSANDPLSAACTSTNGAPGLILAMLLPAKARARERALRGTGPAPTEAWLREAARLSPCLDGVSGSEKLKLAESALPAMRVMQPEAFHIFESLAARLIAGDNDIDLLEYALDKLLERHLAPYFRHPIRPRVEFQSIDQLAEDATTLLSIVARADERLEPAACETAFRTGLQRLRLYAKTPALRRPKECGLGALDTCIQRFHRAADYVREDILAACQLTATAHGDPSDSQSVLLHIISDGVECQNQENTLIPR